MEPKCCAATVVHRPLQSASRAVKVHPKGRTLEKIKAYTYLA